MPHPPAGSRAVRIVRGVFARALRWGEGTRADAGRVAVPSRWLRIRAWLPLACLLVLLGLFLERAQHRLAIEPIPPRSQHNVWELVPRMVHVFEGYQETEKELTRGNWAYACPQRRPIPWSRPGALLTEIREGRLQPLVGHFTTSYWVEMPHSLALAAVAALWFPGNVAVPAMVMLGYQLLMLVSVYGIGREARGPWTGLLAAALCAQSPAFFRYGTAVEGYLPVAALISAMIWSLLRSKGITRPLPVLAFLFLAWTTVRSGEGFSEAVGAGLAVTFPFLFEAIAGVVEQRRAGRSMLRPLITALLVLGLFLATLDRAWVLGSLAHILFGLEETSVAVELADPHAGGMLGWIATHFTYGYMGWTTYLGPLGGIVLLVGLPGAFFGQIRRRWSLLAWVVVPLVAYNWMTRKAEWYALPLIPSLAVLAAVGVTSLRQRWVRTATTVLAVALILAAWGTREPLVGPWTRPLNHIERRLSPDLVHMRAIGTTEDSRTRTFQDLRRFVEWSRSAMPEDGTLHHILATGRVEVPLVHYALVLLRQDLEPLSPPSQPVAPCIGSNDVEWILHFSPEGGLAPLGSPGAPYDAAILAPWRNRMERPEGAPNGVYRVVPASVPSTDEGVAP